MKNQFRHLMYCLNIVALVSTPVVLMPRETLAETPIATACSEFQLPRLDRDNVAKLYDSRAATGSEAMPIVELLREYGDAIEAGDADRLIAVVTPQFDAAMGFTSCPERFFEPGQNDAPTMLLTPMRVTTDDDGNWLAFIQRSYDDGSESGYRDVFMVIVLEQEDGSLLIGFAHRDIQFIDGTFRDAASIYLDGVVP